MRALIDIPQHDLDLLDSIGKSEKVSRAELVRRAISAFLVQEKERGSGIDAAFGSWSDMQEDSQVYLDRLRSEWER